MLGGRAWGRTPDTSIGSALVPPDRQQAQHQFFVYNSRTRPGVSRCLHLLRSVGHIARAGFPYGFCLLAGIDWKMQQLSPFGAVFSFVTCLGVCVRAYGCVVGCNGERTSAHGHRCGQSVEKDLGSKLLSKFSVMSAFRRANLNSPEMRAQFGEACQPFLNPCLYIWSFKHGTQVNSTLDIN